MTNPVYYLDIDLKIVLTHKGKKKTIFKLSSAKGWHTFTCIYYRLFITRYIPFCTEDIKSFPTVIEWVVPFTDIRPHNSRN